MDDNSIITKFDRSEKENRLLAQFYNSKPQKLSTTTSIKSPPFEETKTNFPKQSNVFSDEQVDKFMKDNSHIVNEFTQKSQNISPQDLNVVFNQNKVLGRNVDTLQEMQRTMHDFIIYNMRKEQKEKHKKQNKENTNQQMLSKNQVTEMIKPLIDEVNQLKDELKQTKSTAFQNQISNLNTNNNVNTNNIPQTQNDLKSRKNLLNKKKENSQIIKAINDLKLTMGQMNDGISSMENHFNEQLKQVIEDSAKNKMKSIIDINKTTSRFKVGNFQQQAPSIKSKYLDDIDYNDIKKELLDLNFEKEQIANDYKQKSKLVLEEPPKPKGKINFSYNLDFPSSDTSAMSNSSYYTKVDQSKNVFNNNLLNTKSMQKPNQNLMQNHPNSNIDSMQIKQTQYSTNPNVISSQEPQQKPKDNIDDYNIQNRMSNFKQKMEQKSKMIPSISNEPNYIIPPKQSLNPFDIDNYSSSQPTGNKSVITRQMPKTQENPPEVVYNPLPPKEKFKVGTFEREYPSFKPVDRKDITMVGISPKETEQRKQYEEMLLQLCAEKIIQQRKQTDIPIPMQQEQQLPPSQQEIEHQNRVEKVLDQLLGEKLAQAKKQAMKNKQKMTSSYPNENSSDINTSNTIQKVNVCEYVSLSQNQNQQPQTQMFERLMTNLIDKFGGIEKALKELTLIKNNQQLQNVNAPNANIPNTDEIAKEIQAKFQQGIHVKVNVNDEEGRPVAQNQNVFEGGNVSTTIRANLRSSSNQRNKFNQKPSDKEERILNVEEEENEEEDEGEIVEKKEMKKVKEDIKKKTVPQKKMFLLDESEKISIEELDSRIQAPHKINLSEFDLSKSSLCLSEQKQIELFTQNLNAQSNILDESNNSSNSLSRGQAVSESNSEIHQNVYDNKLIYNENNNERNRTGLDLLRLKEFNENLPLTILQKAGNQIYNNKRNISEGEILSDDDNDEYEEASSPPYDDE